MFKLFVVMLTFMVAVSVAELPTRKRLDLATIKALVAAAEAEAKKLNVEVTICIVDDSVRAEEGAPLGAVPEAIEGRRGCLEGGESGGTCLP
jgi:uncharacterized protein GlcG (DUF336 family)